MQREDDIVMPLQAALLRFDLRDFDQGLYLFLQPNVKCGWCRWDWQKYGVGGYKLKHGGPWRQLLNRAMCVKSPRSSRKM
jgi:hypothetical protein